MDKQSLLDIIQSASVLMDDTMSLKARVSAYKLFKLRVQGLDFEAIKNSFDEVGNEN